MILRSAVIGVVSCLLVTLRFSCGLPMQITINQRQHECLYEKLDEGESVTVSVFILSGNQLKAMYSLQGPIAAPAVDSALELHVKGREFTPSKDNPRQLYIVEEVDFEHLNDDGNGDDDDDVDDDHDDMFDDTEPIDPNDPNAEQKRKERRDRQRSKFVALKKKRDAKRLALLEKIRSDGEPIQNTKKAPEAGWYRMCVESHMNQVSSTLKFTTCVSAGYCLLRYAFVGLNRGMMVF